MAHTRSARFRIGLSTMLFFVILAPLAPPLQADQRESELTEPASFPAQPQGRPSGFRIRAPRVFIGGHLGMNLPRAGSDLFDMVTRELTLEKEDFRAPMIGFDLGVPFRSHWAVVFGFEYGRASKVSESRNYVEDNGLPINQTTRFELLPITGTLRFYPRKMGERIGSYTWIPTRFLPYVGGGGGVVRYDFKQYGSFVDTRTLNIFRATLQTNGYSWTIHAVTGMDISLTPLMLVNLEARYSRAKGDLSMDFAGFQPIDLSGVRLSAGFYFRF